MRIDRDVEGPTRDMLDHAMRGELEDIPRIFQALRESQRHQSLNLCVLIAGYIAIDVSRSQWPSDVVVRRIADNAARVETRLKLDATQVYDFLLRTALRFEPLEQVFPDPMDAALAPILITASLLLTFCPKGKGLWAYLDEIETATEAAAEMKPYMYPAVILRSQIPTQG